MCRGGEHEQNHRRRREFLECIFLSRGTLIKSPWEAKMFRKHTLLNRKTLIKRKKMEVLVTCSEKMYADKNYIPGEKKSTPI